MCRRRSCISLAMVIPASTILLASCTNRPAEFTPETGDPFPADEFATVAVLPVIVTTGPGSNARALVDQSITSPGMSLVYGDAPVRNVHKRPKGAIENGILDFVSSAQLETSFISPVEVHGLMRVSQRTDFGQFLVDAAQRSGADAVLVLSLLHVDAPTRRRLEELVVHFQADLTLYDSQAKPVWGIWTELSEPSLRLDVLVERALAKLAPAVEFRGVE